jgi:hypothetical protein
MLQAFRYPIGPEIEENRSSSNIETILYPWMGVAVIRTTHANLLRAISIEK